MHSSNGFSDSGRPTSIPEDLFTRLLPLIDDLNEFKLTLYFFWRMAGMEGQYRAVSLAELSEDATLLAALENLAGLETALAKAVARGSLLLAGGYYLLNDPAGQAAAEAIASGQWNPADQPTVPIGLDLQRPNIYRLYEQHIGALTPMLADALKAAEQAYPALWLEDAVRIAVENNVRKWRYIEAILERWQREGRDDRTDRGRTEADRKKYTEGEFSDFIER